jgi:hypothetical protein
MNIPPTGLQVDSWLGRGGDLSGAWEALLHHLQEVCKAL